MQYDGYSPSSREHRLRRRRLQMALRRRRFAPICRLHSNLSGGKERFGGKDRSREAGEDESEPGHERPLLLLLLLLGSGQ